MVDGAKGEDVRRRNVECSDGEGGEAGRPRPPDGGVECDETAFILIERGTPFETIRDRGDGGEVDVRRGEAGRVVEFFGDVLGEPGRLVAGT